jgi:hypothetical protein
LGFLRLAALVSPESTGTGTGMRRRLGLRHLMVVIAVLALGMSMAIVAARRSALSRQYRRLALAHAASEANCRLTLELLQHPDRLARRTSRGAAESGSGFRSRSAPVRGRIMRQLANAPGSKDLLTDEVPPIRLNLGLPPDSPPAVLRAREARCAEWIAYHAQARTIYERLADHPWEAVPPLPVPPE